jgi:exonuclease III
MTNGHLMDLTDICTICHETVTKYTLFSAAHETFSKIDHILGHEASLNKYKEMEITPCILSDHSEIILEINSKRNYRKY